MREAVVPDPPGAVPPLPPAPADAAAEAPAQQVSRLRRLVPFAVVASLAVLVGLSLYYQRRQGTDLMGELGRLAPWSVAAALALHLAMQAFWALRIRILARGLGAPVTYGRAYAIVTSGLFAAAVTPGRVGGEPWRIAMLVRGGAGGAAASRTILADRAVDVVFFLVLGLVAVLLLPTYFGRGGDLANVRVLGFVAVLGLALLAGLLALVLVKPHPIAVALGKVAALPDRLRGKPPPDRVASIEAFFREVTGGLSLLLRREPGRLAASAACSVALWTCELSILWVLLTGFGYDAPYLGVYLAGVMTVMVASVPLLPGGTGLAELAALALLTPLAPGLSPAFLVAWRGLTYYMDLGVGGVLAGILAKRMAARPTLAPKP